MKRSYSYFIVKPDGIRYLDEILEDLEGKFQEIKYYAVDDFESLIKKLYHRHYEQKGSNFAKAYASYLYGIREIFGNKALLVLVGDREKTYEELSNDIFAEKTLIRQKYVNNNVGIITNSGDERVNYIRYVDQKGNLKKPRILNGMGNIRISDMNIIHSPDPNEATTKEELQIIINSGILQDKNLLTPDTIKKIREYGTFNFFNDMKKDDYQGNIGPDISGFIKSEIDER
mgnify:CR=1 FL=1